MNHTVVLFLDKNARIIKTDDLTPYEKIPGILIDPDLSAVAGHPPHYWKNEKGKVLPITNEEKIVRDGMQKDLHWNNEQVEKLLKKAKTQLKLRQAVYALVAALLVLGPVGAFLILR